METKRERKNRLQNIARHRRLHLGIKTNRPSNAPATKEFVLSNCVVSEASGCWEWKRNKDTHGYGKVRHFGVTERVHRVAWKLWKGEIPSGLLVLHKCDNPPCCNPDHLFLGTDHDNRLDCAAKERDDYRLTKSQVREIISMDGTLKSIGNKFGVSEATIHKIKHGQHTRCFV